MKERNAWKMNGYVGILGLLLWALIGFILMSYGLVVLGVAIIIIAALLVSSITIVQPNEAKVILFFGSYVGTISQSGMWLTIPLAIHKKVSLRVRNFDSSKLKVNDVEGSPIEIATVVVFRVVDTAKAMFDVDQYEQFVKIQSETALRHVASKYAYDVFGDTGYSLRGNSEEVGMELSRELQERLAVAGVEVVEARLTHLAYSTEIASAMLQRQQADAIVAARQRIVEGAVGMVQLAIAQLQRDGIIELDEERKAAMINNLLVAIVSDRSANPVINTSSLY
ncbi:SPFH domain-containing protein [Paenibacillus thalictri]|uniref:SPFH domain-containing protein n=1 Tax=Paenibacillus thalictri TaxID=2527873 RepID=A0A4Q9DGX3_9BACL|nr:SPFH domain-containing protein [Paenibacillus thalictri]TBL71529.1 SPFH domain-containing protein [Paenibacillus thalictri]